jgi:hypothetical protein
MDTLIKENNIDIEMYDFINLDIQGAELLALKSFDNLINNFKNSVTGVIQVMLISETMRKDILYI